MKRWLFLVTLSSCFPFEGPRTYPMWTRVQSAPSSAGCLQIGGWAAQSGKQGLGLTVEASTQSDACAFALRVAELDVEGEKVAAKSLPTQTTLHRGQTVWVHLPFAFDGDRAWNEGRRTAEVRLGFDGGEVRWAFENRKDYPIECEERPVHVPMKRAHILFAPLLASCIAHTHREANAPGLVDVTKRPADLTDPAPVKPSDPGERAVVVQANLTLHGVGWTNTGRDGHEVFLPFAIEIVPWTFTLAESHRNVVASKVLDGAVRPAVGLSMRVFPKGDAARTTFGPMWYEVQYTWLDLDKFSGITIGAGLTTTYAHVGPQATLCMGAPLLIQLCGRTAYTTDEHTTMQIFVTYDGFAEWVWSR